MIKKIDKWLEKTEVMFLVIGVALMGIIMAMEVFCRLFLTALTWSEELAKYIFVWVVFIGMCYGIGKGLHIRLELFDDKFSPAMKKIFSLICDLICVVIFVFLFKPSIEYFSSQCTQKMATIPGGHMGYVAIAIPITLVLSTIRIIINMVYTVKGGKES